MENDPLLTPPEIWNFPCVLSLFFLKASLREAITKKLQKECIIGGGGIFFHPLYGGREVLKISNLPIFHSLFFTLSVEGGRGKVNDAIFTLPAVFFYFYSFPKVLIV